MYGFVVICLLLLVVGTFFYMFLLGGSITSEDSFETKSLLIAEECKLFGYLSILASSLQEVS